MIPGTLLLLVVVSGLGVGLAGLGPTTAIMAALVAVGLHWFSDLIHQLGHAYAAAQTGYPMEGIRLWWVLSASTYPAHEPALPAAIHIQRALGGPVASSGLTLIALVLALLLRIRGGALEYLAAFLFLENLLVFAAGAFLPLGCTDGSTLLTWWSKR